MPSDILSSGKVFTAFMTGNIVFLGLNMSGAAKFEIVRVLNALVSFSLGVLVFRLISTRFFRNAAEAHRYWPREVMTALVIMVIAQFGFLLVWLGAGGSPAGHVSNILVMLGAFAMGVQTGAVTSLGLTGVVTTAATGTLVALIASIVPYPVSDWRRLAGVLLCLLMGATLEGVLLTYARSYAPLLPLAGTTLALVIAALDLLKHARRPLMRHPG